MSPHISSLHSVDVESGKEQYQLQPLSPSLSMFAFASLASVHTRKSANRNTFIALFILAAVSAYIFFFANPSLTLPPLATSHRLNEHSRPSHLSSGHRGKTWLENNVGVPEVRLTEAQELAAITSFLASLPQNSIPGNVNPMLPIEPHVVLDFDTRGPRAAEEVEVMVEDVWARNPVVIYSRFYSPVSREIKTMLTGMNLLPAPTIFDVDQRDDTEVLTPLLRRLTNTEDLPVLLIGGKPVGTLPEIRKLHHSGALQTMIKEAGGVIDGGKRKKGKK